MELDEPHLLSAALVVGCAQMERPVVCLRRGSASQIDTFLCCSSSEQHCSESEAAESENIVPKRLLPFWPNTEVVFTDRLCFGWGRSVAAELRVDAQASRSLAAKRAHRCNREGLRLCQA